MGKVLLFRMKVLTLGSGIFTFAIIVLAFIPVNISADDGKVALDLQAKLFINALSYNQNLDKRDGSKFDIAIVYFPWSQESKEDGVTFSQILKGFKDKQINDCSFNILLLTYNGGGGLREKITGRNVRVLFVFGEEESMIRDITQLTRSEKILSCISDAKFLHSGNVTMAVGLEENKPKIYLNLSSAKSEGVNFSAKFLRIAEIVDEQINGNIEK